MARKSKLTQAAVKIGTAIGKADRTAHQIAKAGKAAKNELADIGAQINALKRQETFAARFEVGLFKQL